MEYSVTCFLKAGIYALVCGPSHGMDGAEDSFQSFLGACHQESFSHLAV